MTKRQAFIARQLKVHGKAQWRGRTVVACSLLGRLLMEGKEKEAGAAWKASDRAAKRGLRVFQIRANPKLALRSLARRLPNFKIL